MTEPLSSENVLINIDNNIKTGSNNDTNGISSNTCTKKHKIEGLESNRKKKVPKSNNGNDSDNNHQQRVLNDTDHIDGFAGNDANAELDDKARYRRTDHAVHRSQKPTGLV